MEKINIYQFSFKRNEFNAVLAKHGLTQRELADRLGINQATLTSKLQDNGRFNTDEIRVMISIFGMEEVSHFLFNL